MERTRKPALSVLLPSQSGRARAIWTDVTGNRHFRMLPGPHDSAESRTAFAPLQPAAAGIATTKSAKWSPPRSFAATRIPSRPAGSSTKKLAAGAAQRCLRTRQQRLAGEDQ